MTHQKIIINRVKSIIDKQQEKGLMKYGISVDDANLSLHDWIHHAQEEAADLLIYLEKIKSIIESER